MNIEKRKIQQFAKYSYAITLPIHWVKANHLDSEKEHYQSNHRVAGGIDDESPIVNVYENIDGSLSIYSEDPKQKDQVEEPILIDLDEFLKENPRFISDRFIQMILISYYMNGAVGIELVSKNLIPEELIAQIEKTQSRLLLNWNTSRINARKILIKNVFSETPDRDIFNEEIPRYLREIFIILVGMIEDILSAIEENNYEILNTIAERDDKIDRYYFFIIRQIRNIFEKPFSKPLNYSHKKLVDLRMLAKFIEDVGDQLKDSALIIYKIQTFMEKVQLKEYIMRYLKVLKEAYGDLSDLLAKNLKKPESEKKKETQSGMKLNISIMPKIQEFRVQGRQLMDEWNQMAPKLVLFNEQFTFKEYYDGSRLITAMQSVFLKIFDFTNLFF
jgi:phosphate uptake regulator